MQNQTKSILKTHTYFGTFNQDSFWLLSWLLWSRQAERFSEATRVSANCKGCEAVGSMWLRERRAWGAYVPQGHLQSITLPSQQGNPLMTLLFAFYLNDYKACISSKYLLNTRTNHQNNVGEVTRLLVWKVLSIFMYRKIGFMVLQRSHNKSGHFYQKLTN